MSHLSGQQHAFCSISSSFTGVHSKIPLSWPMRKILSILMMLTYFKHSEICRIHSQFSYETYYIYYRVHTETLGKAIPHLGNQGLRTRAQPFYVCLTPELLGDSEVWSPNYELNPLCTWVFAVAATMASNGNWRSERVTRAGRCSFLADSTCNGGATLAYATFVWRNAHRDFTELGLAASFYDLFSDTKKFRLQDEMGSVIG